MAASSSARIAAAPSGGGPASPATDLRLLRSIALGGKRSVEIQLLLDGESGEHADYQKLALVLTGISVPSNEARQTFGRIREHQQAMSAKLGRAIKVKAAALDLLETLEPAAGPGEDESDLTYDQLVRMAFHDHLTGLSNFRFFSRRLKQEVQRAARYKHLLSLIMLDIDHFKNFNDRFGHASGNRTLAHVAALIKQEARETDLAARYGGEEFALVLTETAKHEAAKLAERLRVRIESTPLILPDHGEQRVAVSLGLATFSRDARDAQALTVCADEALYAAKHAGRNRLCLYQPEKAVAFAYKPEHAGAAQAVALVGDFNAWSREADPMQRGEDGSFRLTVKLAPGNYVYKFVINSEFYIADPKATEFIHDGYGGRNSVVAVQ
ncbi:MAG: diguanylate cyclase [Planctomycetes bacterium]|nr:diguanylate cyclase [Planctomycetota bacterium]